MKIFSFATMLFVLFSLPNQTICQIIWYSYDAVGNRIGHKIISEKPEIMNIPDQVVFEGETFTSIKLDAFVVDKTTPDASMNWQIQSVKINSTINNNRVASFGYPSGWIGADQVVFKVTDTDGNFDLDTALFSVLSKTLFLKVSANSLYLDASGNLPDSFTITSNIEWTATSNQPWLNLSIQSGNNNGSIMATPGKNTGARRTAKVTVAGVGVLPQEITVLQNGNATGIESIETAEYSFYPNPATDFVYMNGLPPNMKAEIFDINGKLQLIEQISKSQVDISNLTPGLYIFKISNTTRSFVFKLVKQ